MQGWGVAEGFGNPPLGESWSGVLPGGVASLSVHQVQESRFRKAFLDQRGNASVFLVYLRLGLASQVPWVPPGKPPEARNAGSKERELNWLFVVGSPNLPVRRG